MKYLIIAIAVLCVAPSFAQIGRAEKKISENVTIGEVSLLEYGTIGRLNGSASITRTDTENEEGKAYHMIAFQNQEFKTITDIKVLGFFANQEELDYLFNEMVNVLKTGQEIDLTLGNRTITLSRSMGSKKGAIMFWANGDGYFYLNDQQLYLLFGKDSEWKKDDWNNKAWRNYKN